MSKAVDEVTLFRLLVLSLYAVGRKVHKLSNRMRHTAFLLLLIVRSYGSQSKH